MSGRHTLGIIFGIVALFALVTLAFFNPLAALVALSGALASAIVVLLLTFSKTSNKATLTTDDEPDHIPRVSDISSSALLEAAMDSMREGVLIVDHEMRIIASNAAALNTFQSADTRFENLRLSDVTRNPSIHGAFRAAVEEDKHEEVQVEMRSADRRIFDLRVEPLRFGHAGRRRGAIGVFFDITQLERLERVRQEFLSNVSHELRTPLTAIIAFVETLEEGAIEDQEHNRRFLKVIRKNAERMHNLIDDILELSSIEAGIVVVEPKLLKLSGVVDDVTTALAVPAQARGIVLRNEIDGDVMVFADARRLEQMITNLVDNAIKFNRENGDVIVRFSGTETRDCISVIDNGNGISSEHLERIFERFYRIDRARSRELGGTGLGLAIVKHLARAHGGEASAQSTPGGGSTFSIELPKDIPSDN